MTRILTLAVVLAALALSTTGCGTKTITETGANGQLTKATVANVHFAKSKFVLHLGLAFGAFHRYIYQPFRTGAFRSGAHERIRAMLKGGTAAVFALHELRTAREDALSDDRLRPLAEKVEGLLARLTSLGSSLKGGTFSDGAILGAAGAVTSLAAASGGVGAVIKEVAPVL
jgi:hypothetical protein